MKDLKYINRRYIEQMHTGKLFGHKRKHNSYYESVGVLLDACIDVEGHKREIRTLIDSFCNGDEVDRTKTLIELFNKSLDLTASALVLSIRANEALSTQLDKRGDDNYGV